MALSAHLNELNNKHIKLDEKIRSELKHPMPDTIRLAKLKKQKLQIKEKIIHFQSA